MASEQNWMSGPAGWLQGLGSLVPGGYDAAMRLGARSTIEPLFAALRSRLVGRRVRATVAGRDIALTVTDVRARFDPLGAILGQADDVSFTAEDVEFGGVQAAHLVVRADNVHTRVGINPVLVAAPIHVEVTTDWEQVNALLSQQDVDFRLEPCGVGRVRVRPRTRVRRGWFESTVGVEEGRVVLTPDAMGWGRFVRRRFSGRRPIPVPTSLGPGVRIIEAGTDGAIVTAVIRIDQWSVEYGRLLSLSSRSSTSTRR